MENRIPGESGLCATAKQWRLKTKVLADAPQAIHAVCPNVIRSRPMAPAGLIAIRQQCQEIRSHAQKLKPGALLCKTFVSIPGIRVFQFWGVAVRKFIGLSLAASVAILASGPGALAADLPATSSNYTKAPVIAIDPWTGLYLGASAGGRWNRDPWTTTSVGIPATPPGFLNSDDNPHEFKTGSARLGLYGGYNRRILQTWVVGLEGDLAWANDKTSAAGVPGLPNIPPPFAPRSSDLVQMKDQWDGSLRGRFGYLVAPATLLYGTGGVSWMQSQASVTCAGLASWCSGTNLSTGRTNTVGKTVVGWTLGAGLEVVVMPNWLLRGEYRYSSYGGYHATLLQGGSLGPTGNSDVVDADIGRIRTQTVLVGLAYRFGE